MKPLADARSLLFVPGNRPERFDKALSSGADAVILDLEDAVPPAEKSVARGAIARAWAVLAAAPVPVAVRINAPSSDAGRQDVAWLATIAAVAPALAVIVPKAESAGDLEAVRAALPQAALVPLIESAAGWAGLAEIAAAPGVLRLAFGHIDFMADTGLRCGDDQRELDPLRFAIAMHSRLHSLAAPVDGVTTGIDDEGALRDDTARALRFGFGAKLCIHPRQIPVVHAAMRPSQAEIRWAERVVAADEGSGGAAVQLDGRMIDRPVVIQARRTLARSRQPTKLDNASDSGGT